MHLTEYLSVLSPHPDVANVNPQATQSLHLCLSATFLAFSRMQRISTKYSYSLELLEDLIHTQPASGSTTLIVCWARNDFLDQLLTQILPFKQHPAVQQVPSSQPDKVEDDGEGGRHEAHQSSKHSFLTPTLKLLASSKHIKIVFCPTVPTLRAHLASSIAPKEPCTSIRPPLFILDLLALHHGTSEFTLQGLSRTFASAVSAANRTGTDWTLIECKDVNDPTNPHRGPRLWDQEVPLLSGSIKIGQEGAKWAGRCMTIRKIAGRWFTFEGGNEQLSRASMRPPKEEEVDEMLI